MQFCVITKTLLCIQVNKELKTALINYAIKEYELKRGPLELMGKYCFPENPILKLT